MGLAIKKITTETDESAAQNGEATSATFDIRYTGEWPAGVDRMTIAVAVVDLTTCDEERVKVSVEGGTPDKTALVVLERDREEASAATVTAEWVAGSVDTEEMFGLSVFPVRFQAKGDGAGAELSFPDMFGRFRYDNNFVEVVLHDGGAGQPSATRIRNARDFIDSQIFDGTNRWRNRELRELAKSRLPMPEPVAAGAHASGSGEVATQAKSNGHKSNGRDRAPGFGFPFRLREA